MALLLTVYSSPAIAPGPVTSMPLAASAATYVGVQSDAAVTIAGIVYP